MDPKLFISDPDPTLALISDLDSDPDRLWKTYLKCRSSKHRKKAIFFNLYIFGSVLSRNIYMNCRSSKHCKKATALCLLVGNRTYLDPDLNPNPDPELIPDPNLQMISGPTGSGCTTLLSRLTRNLLICRTFLKIPIAIPLFQLFDIQCSDFAWNSFEKRQAATCHFSKVVSRKSRNYVDQ